MTTRAAPIRASPCDHSGAAGGHQTAAGQATSSLSQAIRPCTSSAARAHSGANRLPNRASGVMTKLINGIAARLASRPTTEICAKQIRLSGARPTVAMAWVRSAALS